MTIRPATTTDVPALADLAARTFPLAAPPHVTRASLDAFIEQHLSVARFTDYLADADRDVLVALDSDQHLVGYALLVAGEPVDDDVRAAVVARPTVELSKIYVDPLSHGGGAARDLVEAAAHRAVERGAATLWLGVNQENVRAQRFYGKSGFVRVGTKRFQVGAGLEHDFVLERVLDRRASVLAAASKIAADHRLDDSEPEIVYDLFSIVVRLDPHPVVLRVPTVLPAAFAGDLDRRAARQADELAVAGWLVERGFPTIAPSPLLPAEPLRCGPWTATAWTWVEHLDAAGTPHLDDDVLPMVARLHRELREYPHELSFMSFWDETIPAMLDGLEGREEVLPAVDLARARREHAALDEIIGTEQAFRAACPTTPVQVIHGDAPTYNLARTADGVLLTDFELATRGPVEWDLALCGDDAQQEYSRLSLAAGGVALDPEVMRIAEAARLVQLIAVLDLDRQSPGLATAMDELVQLWRGRDEFTGVG